jgi:hypothetical protein
VASVLPATGSVTVAVAAPPASLWRFVIDPATPARFSSEVESARYVEGDAGTVGAIIEGHNVNGDFRWTTRSTVVDCVEPTRFAWATGDPPAATWAFDVAPADGGATLTHTVVLHEGRPPLGPAVEADPDGAQAIVDGRLAALLVNMERTVAGIAALAEGR